MGSRRVCPSSAELWGVIQPQRCVWPCCWWRVATVARLESDWTPLEPWSSGRGTCCRRTGACGGRAWTWRWVAPPLICVKRQDTCPLPSHQPLTSYTLGAAVPVHERPGVPRGELLPHPRQRPRPLTLPDLPAEEEALPQGWHVLPGQPLQQQ